MKKLAHALWVVVALLFLLEAWLWDRLEPVVARLVCIIPWGRIKPALAGAVERLSPPATLVVFVIPFILLLPLKFLEVWLLVHRQWLAGLAVLVLAKIVGLGVTAFIFEVTKDKLLQMGWCRQVYAFFIWARTWAHGMVEPVRRRAREWSRETIAPIVQRLRQWRLLAQTRRAGRFGSRLARIRRRMRAAVS